MKNEDKILELKRSTVTYPGCMMLWLTHLNLSDDGEGEDDNGPICLREGSGSKKKTESQNKPRWVHAFGKASHEEVNQDEILRNETVLTTEMKQINNNGYMNKHELKPTNLSVECRNMLGSMFSFEQASGHVKNVWSINKSLMQMGKLLIAVLLLLVVSTGAKAQVGSLTKTEAQIVCIGTVEPYGVMDNAGSTYSWTITPSDGGTISGTTNLIDVTWTKVGTYELKVVERNASGCEGDPTTLTITVNPLNTIALSSAAGTQSQTLCINNVLTTITYATTGATGASVAGLPTGLTGSWAANVFTITGTPTVAGTFNYTVTTEGGCGIGTATGTITVQPENTIALSSVAGTNSQTICIDTPLVNITYATTGASGGSVTGLPAGLTGNWAANVFTISGSPSVAGTYTYTVTTIGGCGTATATGSIEVMPANTIALSSAVGTNNQTVCIDTPVVNITYVTTGVTGATITGLPSGITGSWSNDAFTITGTPSASGTFTYTITTSGGCGGALTSTGTVTVTPANTIALSSIAGTNSQTVCIDNALTNVTFTTTGASGASVNGLPTGVTGTWLNDVVTISGVPTVSGTFTYTVTTLGGCGTATATGSIEVMPANTIALSSPAGTNSQTVCIDSPLVSITYGTTGATGANVTGLPTGLTGSWAANVFTISGTPTVSGTFSYTVTTLGGCGTATSTGSIYVMPANTIALSSVAGTNSQTICANSPVVSITYATTGATGASITGLPTGLTGSWSNDVFTISGSATQSGTFTYSVTTQGGCGVATATGTITVVPLPDPSLNGPSPICESSISNIYQTDLGKTNYVWSVSAGGQITAGGTASDTTVTVTWITPGNQSVTVNYTDQHGCSAVTPKAYNVVVTPLPKTSPIFHK